MVTRLHDHPITWTPPAPFWAAADHAAMQAPSILRFTTDDFMDELQRLLASDPEKLTRHIAVAETWRGINTPARTPNPTGGRDGLFSRLGVTARRRTTPATPKPEPLTTGLPLKLYQPAHQRFYLVGATLVCQRPGLPDRRIDAGKAEKATFVVRRWFPPTINQDDALPPFDSTWIEHAYVAQPDSTFAWVPVPPSQEGEEAGRRVLDHEEQLPMFPLTYGEDDRRTRRLLAGLIPVGKREAYHAADQKETTPANGATAAGAATDDNAAAIRAARRAHFRKIVSEPWKAVIDRAANFRRAGIEVVDGHSTVRPPHELPQFRSDVQLSSWLLLADLRGYLETYTPAVWARVEATPFPVVGAGNPGSLTDSARRLYDTLINTRMDRFNNLSASILAGAVPPAGQAFSVPSCLAEALHRTTPAVVAAMEGAENAFTRATGNSAWPTFLFPLIDSEDSLAMNVANPFGNCPVPAVTLSPPLTMQEAGETETQSGGTGDQLSTNVTSVKAAIDAFAAQVLRSIPPNNSAPLPAVPAAAQKSADLRPGWFTIRCVYPRPHCGALHDDVVSASSERFQLAHFFDPDAPARPIRIGLPIDTTPAGLRKFDKNTAFVMSDVLCGQVARMRGLTFGDLIRSVLPWPLHKDLSVPDNGPCKNGGGANLGLICSLSIPIITICALILLLIMVSLLDMIFKWIPYFILCFPLPGLRAKKQ